MSDISLHDGIALITAGASADGLSPALVQALLQVEADPSVNGIVLIGFDEAGAHSVGGASASSVEILRLMMASVKPVVMLWQGVVRDAVVELGLAAHARVMASDSRIGVHYVKRALVPAMGATQILPRLVGLPAAVDLILSCRMVAAEEAQQIGLVDVVAKDEGRTEALALARRLVGTNLRRLDGLTVPVCTPADFEKASAPLLRRLRGQDAPREALRLIQLAATSTLADGLAQERSTAAGLQQGPQAAALRYVAWAERDLATRANAEMKSARTVERIGIVGAGTMGTGIAVSFLDAGYDVTLIETSETALERGCQRIDAIYERLVTSGRMRQAVRQERRARLHPSTDLDVLSSADLVLEAIFEDMDAKLALWSKLDAIAKPACIFATNTSYLNIDLMAERLTDPSRLVGMHFFSPAHLMKMLEVVRGEQTAVDVVTTALAIGRRLGKLAVVAGVCDGFIGNRIFSKYRILCEFMLEEGALPFEIDDALEAYGFAMGPFAASDLAGLDISWARRKAMAPNRHPHERYVPIADQICEMGRFGQKTGAGWYSYENGKRGRDLEIETLVRDHAAQAGHPQKTWTSDEIVARVLAVMANEGAHILGDGIAACPSDIDLVLLNGYGFPAYRGGPMFAADLMGWERVVHLMEEIAAVSGPAFSVAPISLRLARDQSRATPAI